MFLNGSPTFMVPTLEGKLKLTQKILERNVSEGEAPGIV